MENEMTVYEPEKDLSMARPPNIVLEEAKTAAKALGDILSKKKKPVIMNGEQYLEFEDWQTVGRFYGITAKEDEDAEIVEIGGAIGFKASSVALRSDGAVISRATAYCMNDEQNWKTKPLFQLASMAQTRANSKALRNVLAWVVVLAGYKPTPAEEMEGVDGKGTLKEPQKKNGEKEVKDPNAPATEAQTKALHSILGHLKITDDFAKHSKVSQILGLQSVIESFSKLTKGQASASIEALQKEAQEKK